MLYLVVEKFRDQDAKAVYRWLDQGGQMAPEGLVYRGSWVAADLGRCFQLVGCDDIALLQQLVANWQDLVEFEIVPVLDGDETARAIQPMLE